MDEPPHTAPAAPPGIPLGAGAEFDVIRAIATALGPTAHDLGDDAAALPGAPEFVVSVDATVEWTHFEPGWLTDDETGWRAAASALSDLAAMGAAPVAVLVALTLPRDARDRTPAIMRGVGAAAASVGAAVIGGDVTSGAVLQVVVTVVGRTRQPVRRQGARAGDRLWVTGRLGGAGTAVAAWLRGESPSTEARIAFAHPVPRIAAGQWLARAGATAMIDLSDGLAGDAGHLAAASGVAITVQLEALPCAAGATPELAATGGEDYELLVALPPRFGEADAARCAREIGVPLTCVGEVAAGAGVTLMHHGVAVALHGFDHFA